MRFHESVTSLFLQIKANEIVDSRHVFRTKEFPFPPQAVPFIQVVAKECLESEGNCFQSPIALSQFLLSKHDHFEAILVGDVFDTGKPLDGSVRMCNADGERIRADALASGLHNHEPLVPPRSDPCVRIGGPGGFLNNPRTQIRAFEEEDISIFDLVPNFFIF